MNTYLKKLISEYVDNHNIYMTDENCNLTNKNIQDMELGIVMELLKNMGYKYKNSLYIK